MHFVQADPLTLNFLFFTFMAGHSGNIRIKTRHGILLTFCCGWLAALFHYL